MDFIKREQPGVRDILASNIAGVLIDKSDLKIASNDLTMRKVSIHTKLQIEAIAFLAYKLADAMIVERNRDD